MKKKWLSLFLTASLILSGQAGWLLRVYAQEMPLEAEPSQEEQEMMDQSGVQQETPPAPQEPDKPDAPQDAQPEQSPKPQDGEEEPSDAPQQEEPDIQEQGEASEQQMDSLFAAQADSVALPDDIFSKQWNAQYDVLYHEADKSYAYDGKQVSFPDENTVVVGEQEYPIRNAQFRYEAVTTNGRTEISFTGLEIPVGSIPSEWNSSYDGVTEIRYQYNGETLSSQGRLFQEQKLVLDTPRKGSYTLTGGSIFEKSNTYGDGHDFGDGHGVVLEREFGYLPELVIEVTEEPGEVLPPEPAAPFTAALAGAELTVRKTEDEMCEATFQNTDVYQIVIPADFTEKTVSIKGLAGWGYIKDGCTGSEDERLGEEDWQTSILPKSGHYHLKKGSELMHIRFDFEGEEIKPEAVPVPFTAKAKEASLTITELPADGRYPACSLKHTYEIAVPAHLKDETIVLDGLQGFYYRPVKSEKSCWGGFTPASGPIELQVNEFGYHLTDQNNVSQNPEYKNLHIVFRIEESAPNPPEQEIPFTAKAKTGGQSLTIVKKSGAGTYGDDVYTVTLPLSVSDRRIVLEGLKGFSYIKNSMMGMFVQAQDPWELTVEENDFYYLSNWDSNTSFEIHFDLEKGPEPEPDQEIPATDAPFTAQLGDTVLPIFKIIKPAGFEGPECQKNRYRVQVSESARGEQITIKGLEGSQYAHDQCDGTLQSIPSDWSVTAEPQSFYHIVSSDSKTQLHIEFVFVAVDEAFEPLPPADPTIPEDFENDLWLQYDFKEMKTGESADIYPRRVPQLIDSAITNNVSRPMFRFRVIRGNSIELSADQSREKVQAKAVKNGISIVEVTYDAQDEAGASSRVNTAYVVFDVNDSPAELEITTDLSKWRSYDTIYFTQGNSTTLPLTVKAPGAQKLEVTCNGHLLEGTDGRYTAVLENKSNIIGIKATDAHGRTKSLYQVVDARKMEIILENINDPANPIRNHGEPFQLHDRVRVSFRGITMPVYKLATIYNPCFGSHDDLNQKNTWPSSVVYQNKELGDAQGELHGFCSQWDLARRNSFEITLDREGSFELTGGHIVCNWWGMELGGDKEIDGQGSPNLAAPIRSGVFSLLPDFTLSVGKTDAIRQTEQKIEAIGTVTLEKEQLILDARAAYEALKEAEHAHVSNYRRLLDAEKRLNELKFPEDAAAINAVMEKIAGIGTVTLEKESLIREARQAYNILSESLKKQVRNISDLEQAEKRLEQLQQNQGESQERVAQVKAKIAAIGSTITLQSEKAILDARKAYEELTQEEKALIDSTEYEVLLNAEQRLRDLQAAKLVDDKIEAIGTVTLKSKLAIKNAREAYEHLTPEQKKLVKKLDILLKAEQRLAELEKPHSNQVDWVMDLIDSIGKVTLEQEDIIRQARSYYNRLTPQEKQLVKNYDKLLKAERELRELKQSGSQRVNAVIEKIKQIGTTITLNSRQSIEAARKAYDALDASQKKLVTNLQTLLDAEGALRQLQAQGSPAGSAPSVQRTAYPLPQAAASVDIGSASQLNLAIDQLPMRADEFTARSERMVLELYRQYNEMSQEQQAQVDSEQLWRGMQALASRNQQDERSGISISNTEWFVKLDVAPSPDLNVLSDLQEKIGEREVLGLWDITPIDLFTQEPYHPTQAIQVALPLGTQESKNLCIVHYDDEGSIEYIKPQLLGGRALFETTEFSNYALVRYEEGDSPFDLNGQLTQSTGAVGRRAKGRTADGGERELLLTAAFALVILQFLTIVCLLVLTVPIIREYYFKQKRGSKVEK